MSISNNNFTKYIYNTSTNRHKPQNVPQPVFKLGAKSATCYVKIKIQKKKIKITKPTTTHIVSNQTQQRQRQRCDCDDDYFKSALNFDFIWRLTYLASKAEPVRPSSDATMTATATTTATLTPTLLVSDATERRRDVILCSHKRIKRRE